jgi:hypothetical protein
MWKLTVVADARPAIILVVASTCLREITVESFAGMATVVAILTLSSVSEKVAADAAVLVTTISVITVVVDAGTVYSVVLDVAAAPLKRAFDVVAISYYPFDCCLIKLLLILDNEQLLLQYRLYQRYHNLT